MKRIVMLGAGRLATQVATALVKNGLQLIQVYSKTIHSAEMLGKELGVPYTNDLHGIFHDADLYIIALKDDVVSSITEAVNFGNALVVHTAGSLPMEVLKGSSDNYGVFYPLQTFSKTRYVDFQNIPICIEANSADNELLLLQLGGMLSGKVYRIDSRQRANLHLAAVFTCNFVNHLYSIGGKILEESDLSFDLLRPLITETCQKILHMTPQEAQTGPAVRYDKNIIKKHLDMLKENDELYEIYMQLSNSIFNFHQKGKS